MSKVPEVVSRRLGVQGRKRSHTSSDQSQPYIVNVDWIVEHMHLDADDMARLGPSAWETGDNMRGVIKYD